MLEAIESTKHVGGALFSQVALQVFDLNVGVGEYEKSPPGHARIYHTVKRTDPKYTTKLPDVLYRPRKFMRPSNNSYVILPMAHRIVMTELPYRNLKRLRKEPYTGEIKTESILDLMDEARRFYKRTLFRQLILGQRITLEGWSVLSVHGQTPL